MEKREGVGAISEAKIHQLVVGADFFNDAFGDIRNLVRHYPEVEAENERIWNAMRAAWRDPDVRQRVYANHEEHCDYLSLDPQENPPWCVCTWGDPDDYYKVKSGGGFSEGQRWENAPEFKDT